MGAIVREGEASRTGRVRVLIADDDRGVRRVLKEWLERHGAFDVTGEADDGLAAIEEARRSRPDLAVLDIALPGVDGLKTASEIRQLLPGIRIVIRSALSAERMADKAIDAGADAYLETGMSGPQFLALLEGLFPGSAIEAAPAGPQIREDGAPSLPEPAELLEAAEISSPVGAALFDRFGRLVMANPVADRLLGGTAFLGATPPTRILRRVDTGESVHDEDLPVRLACKGVPFDDVELLVVDEDDGASGTYVRVSGRPVFRPLGEPGGAVVSVFDDTAAKLTLQALAVTQAELRRSNAELDNFASTASHELAQPLQKVYLFAQILRERGPQDPRADDFIDRIVTGCGRMRTLIDDLLTYSRLTTKARPFEPVELGDAVDEVVELFQQDVVASGARITTGTLPKVLADRTQMIQLFQNLIGNALRYVDAGVAPEIHISAVPVQQGWQIQVADNGIGIRPEDRERAFSMFQRLVSTEEYAGTGIGLAVCARILDRHGGRIWIEDNPGGGTIVCFKLPDRPSGNTAAPNEA